MYKGMDRDELQNGVYDIHEAVQQLHSVIDLIGQTCMETRSNVCEELCDIINDMLDEVSDMNDALHEANRREEAEEERDYYNAVAPSYWDRVIC